MTWWINLFLGILIGSFLATYVEGYRSLFKTILDKLASGKKKKK